jgi:uncharacterized membrane protein
MTIVSTESNKKAPLKITSPWSYFILPIAVLFISLIVGAIFFGRLPQDVAYRFSGAVIHTRVARSALIALAVCLQLVFTVISVVIVLLATSAVRRMHLTETQVNRTVFILMGNMLVLPMIIVFYGMLGILLYNIYGSVLPALWAFALVVLVAGAVIMAVLFTRAFAQSRKMKNSVDSGRITDVRD